MNNPEIEKMILDAAIKNLDREYELIYVDYRDELHDDQIARWFRATQDGKWEVENEVYDAFDEGRFMATEEAIKDAVEQALKDLGLDDDIDAENFLIDHDDVHDELQQMVWDRDKSNPWNDLLRNTPSKLVRCPLGDDGEWIPSAWASDDDARAESIAYMAETLHIDADVNRDKLEELFDNAGGGYLQVIWDADLSNLMRYDENGNLPTRAALVNPYVLVIDTLNGSGHDAKIIGTITVDLADLVLDHDSFGYGWDEIAGVVRSAYEPDDATYRYPVSLRKKAA